MFEPINQAAQFLTQTLIELYILLVCLRVIMHWAKVHHANPILLSIARVTYPLLRPIYSIVPTLHGIDLAAVILLSTLSMAKIGILFWWQMGYLPPLTGLAVVAFAAILKQFIDIFFLSTLMFGVMSWLQPTATAALVELVLKISGPLLRPAQELLPSISGLDFSVLFVMIGLKLINILIVNPLMETGMLLIKSMGV